VVGGRRRSRPALAAPVALRKICASAEPEAVPSVRPDWIDIWAVGEPGSSRTQRVRLALEGDEEIVVIAFDPDAAFNADALVLANACRASGRVAIRSAGWALAAAPRQKLAAALAAGKGGRDGLERAILELGFDVLEGVAYTDPASMLLAQMTMPLNLTEFDRLLARAQAENRTTTANELEGRAALCYVGPAPVVDGLLPVVEPQDPECKLVKDAAFVRFDPANLEPIVELARAGTPVNIAVPLTCGIGMYDAFSRIARALSEAGINTRTCSELALIERQLFECEIAWLQAHHTPTPN
jgi:hypothetical protein